MVSLGSRRILNELKLKGMTPLSSVHTLANVNRSGDASKTETGEHTMKGTPVARCRRWSSVLGPWCWRLFISQSRSQQQHLEIVETVPLTRRPHVGIVSVTCLEILRRQDERGDFGPQTQAHVDAAHFHALQIQQVVGYKYQGTVGNLAEQRFVQDAHIVVFGVFLQGGPLRPNSS